MTNLNGKIPGICDRCHKPNNNQTTMSMFNEDMICMPCKDEEKKHKDYAKASKAELDACKLGDMNFVGLGLPKDLLKNIITLKSVGCAYDTSERRLYPIFKEGGFDMFAWTSIDNINYEWNSHLSDEDKNLLIANGVEEKLLINVEL
jgi:hypothetical protein